MEFYGGSLGFGTEALKFQFPTGWNSTYVKENQAEVEYSFNSQRDGILLVLGIFLAISKLFQFPTGWNSTDLKRYDVGFSLVSIPNGMEFY